MTSHIEGGWASQPQEPYIVKQWDTLSKIAKANHMSVAELARINNIDNRNLISTGKKLNTLKSDVTRTAWESSKKPTTHETRENNNADKELTKRMEELGLAYDNLWRWKKWEKLASPMHTIKKKYNDGRTWSDEESDVPYYAIGPEFLRLYGWEEAVKTQQRKMDALRGATANAQKVMEKTDKFKTIAQQNITYLNKHNINIAWLQQTLGIQQTWKMDGLTVWAIVASQKKNGITPIDGVITNELVEKLDVEHEHTLRRYLEQVWYEGIRTKYGVNKSSNIKIKGTSDFTTPGYPAYSDALKNPPDISKFSQTERGSYISHNRRGEDWSIEEGVITYWEPYITRINWSDGKITYWWVQHGSEKRFINGQLQTAWRDGGIRRVG